MRRKPPGSAPGLADEPGKSRSASTENDVLQHELRVHRVELEAQNEELRGIKAALEESRQRYLLLYEFAPIAYLTLTVAGLIAEANLTAATQLGIERKMLVGLRFASLLGTGDRDRWQQFFLQRVNGIGLPTNLVHMLGATGKYFLASINCQSVEADDGEPRVHLTITDLTALQQNSEEDLRIAAVAFDSSEAMVITDPCSNILKVNKAFCDLTGYSATEAVGRRMSMLNSGRHDELFFRAMWDEIRQDGAWQGEIWDKHKSGEINPQWLTITAVRNESGVISHYVGTLTDITDRVKQREQMERELAALSLRLNLSSRQLLAVQEETRRRLAAELHDRTKPNLAAMEINLSLVEEAIATSLPEQTERVADTRALVEDTETSIREICAELRPVALDYAGLGPTLQGYASQFSKRTGIAVTLDLTYDRGCLEPGVESVLFRICQEALTNVAKHADARVIAITLDCRGRPAKMTICDDGKGFEPDKLRQIGQVGLGLVNMQEMAAVSGGRLTIASQLGQGTRIQVSI